MPKTKKIHAMRLKAQVDIPVDPSGGGSIDHARGVMASIKDHVKKLGYVLETIDYRLVRIPAPEPAQEAADAPEPAGDGLDIPDNLRRTGKPESAAAE